MAPIIALYPGQGSQKQGMAIDLYQASPRVRQLFDLASDIAGRNLFTLLCEGDEETLQTHAQMAITVSSLSAQIRLNELGIQTEVHAGFSLGELCAYCCAGVYDDATLFSIVKHRTALMDAMSKKARETQGELGMAAIIGLDYQAVTEILQSLGLEGLYAANDNAPNQVVLSGLSQSIAKAKQAFLDKKANRFINLKVSGPFHTPFMEEASLPFKTYLDGLAFNNPHSLLFSSVDGNRIASAEEARLHLSHQLARPVRWTTVMQKLKALEQSSHYEVAQVGYGTVLSGLCKSNAMASSCFSLGEETTIQAYAKERAL